MPLSRVNFCVCSLKTRKARGLKKKKNTSMILSDFKWNIWRFDVHRRKYTSLTWSGVSHPNFQIDYIAPSVALWLKRIDNTSTQLISKTLKITNRASSVWVNLRVTVGSKQYFYTLSLNVINHIYIIMYLFFYFFIFSILVSATTKHDWIVQSVTKAFISCSVGANRADK